MTTKTKKTAAKIDYLTMIKIKPLRDHDLNCPPHFSEQLKEGEEIEIPQFLKSTLITEGVIKKGN